MLVMVHGDDEAIVAEKGRKSLFLEVFVGEEEIEVDIGEMKEVGGHDCGWRGNFELEIEFEVEVDDVENYLQWKGVIAGNPPRFNQRRRR